MIFFSIARVDLEEDVNFMFVLEVNVNGQIPET
ncbi:hypothetical protein T08_16241 [Trichinella sp. T8]|nr:hypothetical protein T08_16241 [Trichinella sp. T8]